MVAAAGEEGLVSRVPTVRKADLDRVLKSLADHGQRPGTIIVRPSGEVEITPALTGEPAGGQGDDLDEWRRRRAERKAQGA